MTERVYNGYPVTAQQKWKAHLRRHFKKVVSLSRGNNPMLGQVFLDLIDEANACASVLARNTRRESIPYLGFWIQGADNPDHRAMERPEPDTTRLCCCDRYETEPSSGGTSKGHPEVPPDNNQAERSLRLAVTKRKVSGGSRSMERFAQTADLLSVVQTCRRQGRSVIKFFQSALMAKSGNGNSQPSLLPQPTT